jgi:putative hydrolase of the HAD superfamily
MIRTILFDLDDTLYPRHSGIMDYLRDLIMSYMQEQLKLSTAEADALRQHYFQVYGTTMRGLQVNHHIDPDEYLHYVHDIPLDQFLAPNPTLDSVLAGLPQRKIIFTNASREHAERVLETLGVRHHFVQIVDVRDMDYKSKPHAIAYRRICELLDVEPQECLLVEDNVRNLQPAKALGMTTVLVGDGNQAGDESVDFAICCVENIAQVLIRLESMHPSQSS